MKNSEWNSPFVSLKYRKFRIYWIGMCVSIIGTWMQNIAQPWLAYKITNSSLKLGIIGVVQFLPVLLLSIFIGAIIERFPKKKVLLITQFSFFIITVILSYLSYMNIVQYWHILLLSLLMGFTNAFDTPARHSFFVSLVDKKDLMNAVSLNSVAFNIARIIGPAIAGILMGKYGVTSCFVINAISYLIVFISILRLDTNEEIEKKEKMSFTSILSETKSGFIDILENKKLFNIMILVLVVGTFAPNFSVLIPVYTIEVLKKQESVFGFLMTFIGVGAFIGAMLVAMRSTNGPKNRVIYLLPILIGLALTFEGITKQYFIFIILIMTSGFLFVTFTSIANATLQLNVDPRYRGRIMSIYTFALVGTTPIGNYYAGFLSEYFGVKIGFIGCGLIILFLLVPFYMKKSNEIKIE